MTEMLDKNIQRKQWLKLAAFALLILAIVLFAGLTIKGNGNGVGAMGTTMSDASKESMVQATGVMDIQHWTNEEGVRVYYVHAPELPMVDVDITFDAGSARDTQKQGVAYLTNDLLAEGTQEVDADTLAEELESLGAQVSYTAMHDMASIHLRSLTDVEILVPAVKLMGEVIAQPAFPEAGFLREQQNTLKLLEHEAQSPRKVAERAFYEALYANQPYANWPHGSKESIEQITPADLKAFHNQYYVAKNAVVSIVGAVDLDGANAIAQMLTQGLSAGEKAPKLPEVAQIETSETTQVDFPSAQTHIMFGAPMLTRMDEDYFPLYVGNHVLGGNGTVTRLFHAIRHDKGLAYDVHSYLKPMRVKGPYVVGCQTKKESAQEALKIMQKTVNDFIEQGPTQEELNDAKLNLLGGFPLRFDSNRSIASHINVLAFYELPINYFDQYKKGIEEVTVDNVKEAYKRRIDTNKMPIVMVGRS